MSELCRRVDRPCIVESCSRSVRYPSDYYCSRCWLDLSPQQRARLQGEPEPQSTEEWDALEALWALPAVEPRRAA